MIFVNLILSALTFIRLLWADDSISYDYQFYIAFFNELNSLSIFEFISRIGEGFPYVSWGVYGAGKFECGFATLAYTFGKLFNPNLLYSLIATISIYIKLDILRRFKIGFYECFIFYIFDISIFETNQIRAGLALAIFMVLIYNHLNRNNKILSLFLIASSALMHVSIIVLIAILYLSKFITTINKKYYFIILLFLIEIVFVWNLDYISSFFGGKVAEYNLIANNFDMYNKTSGINIASILAITFTIYFFMNRKSKSKNENWVYGFTFSGICAILIIFSNYFIVLSDRIWLLSVPVILLFYSAPFSPPFSINYYKNIIRIELFLYVIVNLLYRYPASNFFDFIFIIPEYKLIPSELY